MTTTAAATQGPSIAIATGAPQDDPLRGIHAFGNPRGRLALRPVRRASSDASRPTQSPREGEKTSRTSAPDSPAVTLCGVLEGMRQMSPGSRCFSSWPIRKVTEPRIKAKLLVRVAMFGQGRMRFDLDHAIVIGSPWTARAR